MKIRLFDKNDIAAILAVQQKSPEAARWTRGDYERLAEDPGGKILVAELETMDPPKLLGFAAFHRILDEVELRNTAVDPEHRQSPTGGRPRASAQGRSQTGVPGSESFEQAGAVALLFGWLRTALSPQGLLSRSR
jgi:hypothetical protein